MPPVNSYRAYFIDRLNHVESVASIEAMDINSACAQAESLLAQTRYAAVEIWEGSRIVGRKAANRSARMTWPFRSRSDEAV
jgi:hypothetical protein